MNLWLYSVKGLDEEPCSQRKEQGCNHKRGTHEKSSSLIHKVFTKNGAERGIGQADKK